VLLTATNTISRHTIVASVGLSHFLNFAQTILSARYSNVHLHSQLFQKHILLTSHKTLNTPLFTPFPPHFQPVKPSNSLSVFRTTALYRLQHHNNGYCLSSSYCPLHNTVCQYAQYTVITYSNVSSFTSNSHTLQPSTAHCIRMLDRCFQTKCFAILRIFPQRQPDSALLKMELSIYTRKCANGHYRYSGTVCWKCNSL